MSTSIVGIAMITLAMILISNAVVTMLSIVILATVAIFYCVYGCHIPILATTSVVVTTLTVIITATTDYENSYQNSSILVIVKYCYFC